MESTSIHWSGQYKNTINKTMKFSPYFFLQNVKSIIILIVICFCFFSIRKCREHKTSYEESKKYLASLNDTIKYLKNGIAQKPVAEISTDLFNTIVKERDDYKLALEKAKIKPKNVTSITQVVTELKTDTITIRFVDTLPCDDFIPIAFEIDTIHYTIKGKVNKSNINIDKINFPDSLYVIAGKKKHFFRKDEYIVSVGHSNPYVRTIGLTNMTIKNEDKWYDSKWLPFGFGILSGMGLGIMFYKTMQNVNSIEHK